MFRLDSGREVRLEECHIERSALGWIEGSTEIIRADVIETLPKRLRKHFPGEYHGVLVKPIVRSCRVPLVDEFEADFHGDKAKLIWPTSLDGKKTASETYRIIAVAKGPR
ncbi:MAG: hypothetical protein ACRD4S_16290 [Candidatus Acidiferrales bacterium]